MNKSFRSIVVDAKGHENIPFGQKDARNHVDRYKRSIIEDGDAHTMEMYFIQMQQKNSNFFFRVNHDEDRRLQSVFWVDARSRAAYSYFGDVVTFDTTFCTNRYELKFAPFVGVNHHGQSVLLGCGLLANQSAESFVWLFKTWLEAMSGSLPNAIITDECKAMAKAIPQVFPNAHHRLCLWHIMKKLCDKLGSLKEYNAIKRAMQKAVYDSLRVNDFEDAWETMIEKYQLRKNKWLTKMYGMREKWVPVYFKDVFFAGMTTTQRSESMNAYFDGYVSQKTSLREFVDRYELALADQREKEDKADFQCFNSSPALKTCYSFERQFAKIYTISMFVKFQEECIGVTSCSKSITGVDEGVMIFEVKEKIWDEHGNLHMKTYEVKYSVEGVYCICGLFQHKGILCRHSLCVLNEYVTEISPQYILLRWRKDFKRSYVESRVTLPVEAQNPIQRYDVLYPYTLQILDEAVLSNLKFKVVLDGLRELHKKVLSQNEASCDNNIETLGCSSGLPEAQEKERPKLLNPLQAKQKRQQKRLQPPSEKHVTAKRKKASAGISTAKAPRNARKRTTSNNKVSTDEASGGISLMKAPRNARKRNTSNNKASTDEDYANETFASQVAGSQHQLAPHGGSSSQQISPLLLASQMMGSAYTTRGFDSQLVGSQHQLGPSGASSRQQLSPHLLASQIMEGAYTDAAFSSQMVGSRRQLVTCDGSQRQHIPPHLLSSQMMESLYTNEDCASQVVGSRHQLHSHGGLSRQHSSPYILASQMMESAYTNEAFASQVVESHPQLISPNLLSSQVMEGFHTNDAFSSHVVGSHDQLARGICSRRQMMEGLYTNKALTSHVVGSESQRTSQQRHISQSQYPSDIPRMDASEHTTNHFYTELLRGSGCEQTMTGDMLKNSTTQERDFNLND